MRPDSLQGFNQARRHLVEFECVDRLTIEQEFAFP